MFLLERAHVVRAPFLRRRTDDWVWLGGTILLFLSFGAITIWAYIGPYADLNPVDGRCRIGIAKIPGILLLVFDALINGLLTAIFIVLLLPVVEFRKETSSHYRQGNTPQVNRFRKALRNIRSLRFKEDTEADRFLMSIKKMLWKNAVGSALTFTASASNLIVFFSGHGRQVAFVCFAACMADGEFSHLSRECSVAVLMISQLLSVYL